MKKTISIVMVLGFITGSITSVTRAKLVACVGDSFTYSRGLGYETTYPTQLGKILRESDPNWQTRNFGALFAGVSSTSYKPYMDQPEYENALNCEPDVVIIGLGAYDYYAGIDTFIVEYSALIDSFAELPNQPLIWICTAPWFVSVPAGYGNDKTLIRDTINPLIQQVATIKNVPVIDWYTLFEDKPDLFQSDGIHWNIEGAKLAAEIVASTILRAYWPPDFNGDSSVNIEDLVILIENWGKDEPSVDIVPRPLGDGTVDVLDLETLMNFWGQEPSDPTLVAHWELDEVDGMFATDSVGDNDAFVVGGTEWQPNSGQVHGALQLDGSSGCAIAGFTVNPTEGPFSIIGWVKDGAPEQVIVSQQAIANWLAVDVDGNLITELKSSEQLAGPLVSEKVITDGQWHRIGLIWDGSHRTLCVDGVVVAEDTQLGLVGSQMGLYIGTDKAMEAGTYFSGLIDDIRIYNRAVIP